MGQSLDGVDRRSPRRRDGARRGVGQPRADTRRAHPRDDARARVRVRRRGPDLARRRLARSPALNREIASRYAVTGAFSIPHRVSASSGILSRTLGSSWLVFWIETIQITPGLLGLVLP